MISIILPTIKEDLGELKYNIKKTSKDYEIITSGKKGFNTSINDAVSRAKGDYLVFIHDDCEPTEGWLDVLDECGVFLVGENDGEMDIWGGYYKGTYNTDINANPDYSYFMCLSKEVASKVFPLDERFQAPWCQDVDFGLTIKKAGYKIKCLPGRIIHHHIGGHKAQLDNEKYLKEKWEK